jgi:hypothetical protein
VTEAALAADRQPVIVVASAYGEPVKSEVPAGVL